MSDFDRNYATATRGVGAGRAVAIDAGLRAYMIRVYNYMAIGVALTGVAAWVTYIAIGGDSIVIAGNAIRGLTPLGQTLFQSGWFVEGLLTQTLIVHTIRTQKIPFLQSRASGALLIATSAIMAIGVFLPMGPLANYFKMQALPPLYFLFLVAILLGYMVLTQAMKGFYTRRYGWQ